MSDILLSVGLQKGSAETSQIQADLQSIISRIDKNPPKVKVGLQVDQSAINHFKSQLTQIVNSVGLSKGAPITVNISGIGEITTQAGKAKKALEGVAKAGKQAADAVNKMSAKQSTDAITKINQLLIQMQANQAKWTAAQVGSSSVSYAAYSKQIDALIVLKGQVDANAISAEDFAVKLSEIRAAASDAAAAIKAVGEDHTAKKVTVLEHNTEEYRNALLQCNKELTALRKNQEQWTAAKSGRGASDYSALQTYEKAIEALIADLSTGKMTLDEFKARFGAIKSAADSSRSSIRGFGEDTKALGDRLKGLADKFGAWLSVSQAIMFAIRAVKQMITAVREVDTAMTELKKVTNETNETYNKFLSNASVRAKQIGASLSDVITASADFARLGYGIDDAAKLADAALIYKNIGDGIEDITTASESIISTMQAFGIEASNVMSIVDKFNEVGNNFAISSAGIGEAMQRSAAAMASANNTIEETIALITAANTIVQNPESVGTTLKTVSMYLRAAKTEAEEAGESTDGMANSVSELRSEILQLTGQRVDIQIDEDTFKSTYQILKELSAVWDDLTDVSQANILELVGGKRNSNVVSALLENFTVAEEALQTAAKSAGSAIAENEKQLESIEGKIAKFKAAFQTFSQNLIGSDTVKLFVDIGTALIIVLDKLQQLHLLLPTIIAAFVAFKGIGVAKNLSTITAALIANKAATDSLSVAVSQLTVRQKLRLVEDIKAAVASGALTKEQGQQILTTLGLVAADGALTVANKGLAASFKSLMASIPMWGWIALGISVVIEGITLLTSSVNDSSDSIETLSEEAEQLTTNIRSTANEYRNLRDSATDIIPRFAELAKGVNQLGENVSLTDEEYEEFLSLNNQIAEMFPELNMGMDSNGNAMLSLSYTADTLAESLWNVVEAERAAANQTIADTMPDVLSNIDSTVDKYRDEIAELSDIQSQYFDTYSAFLTKSLPTDVGRFSTLEAGKKAAEEFIAIAKELGIHGNVLVDNQQSTNNGYVFSVEWDYSALDHKFLLEEVETQFELAMQKYDKLINDYNTRIAAKWQQLNPVVGSWLQTDFMFQDLDGTMQEIAQVMVSGLDFGSLGLKTQEEVQNYVQTNIVEPLFLASPAVKDAFANITNWKEWLRNGDITFEQFSEYITNAFNGLFEQMDSGEIEMFKTIFVSAFNQIGIAGSDFETVLTNLIAEWGKLPGAADAASDSLNVFASVSEKLTKSKENIDSLSDAMSKLADGSLEVWDVVELIKKFPELAEYVDLTADGFGNLSVGLRALAQREVESFISEMQKFKETNNLTEEQAAHIDALCNSIRNLSAESVQNLTGEFGVLAESIQAATQAQNELEAALAEDDWDTGYEGRVEAYGGFQEVLDAGEYGSKAYAAYKEYFGLIEKSPEQIKAWMESNKKYFTEGTDGVLAFLQTVESLSGTGGALDGIASFDADTGEFWYDINELGAFADALGWTEEMLQDFIYKYRMYCEEWESRSPADTMKELTNAGLISQIGNVDFGPTFASLKELQEYTGLGEQGVYDLIDSINELRAQEGLPNISLIGRDITEVTQTSITQWQNLGATAEEVSALLIELAQQDVAIAPNLYIDTESGPQIDVDTLLAEAGIDGSETVHIEVDMTVNNEPAMATIEATVAEVEAILGEGWEALLSADSADAETRIQAVQTLLEELPPSTDVMVLDSTGLACSNLSKVIDLLGTIDANKTKTITIRYQTIGMPMFADGTSGAKAGPALLGDEYSPSGSPKPELVVSGNRAYLAGQNGPEIGYLNDGDIVYTADETRRILHGNILHSSIPAHAGGTAGGLIDTGGLSGGDYNFSGKKPSGNNSNKNNKDDDEESWFERQYKDHQHWLAMDQESVDDYLKWLDEAYQKAYEEGVIDLDEYYKYQEEVYQGVQDQFKDHINDIDHEISLLEAGVGNSDEIINLSLQAMADIEAELAAARAEGLDENSDYIQWLEQQWMNYSENVTDMREQAETEAQSSIDDIVEYRIDMLKQEIQDQKDALSEQLDDLQDFYDKQRKMLQDQYDEEKYMEEQKEKRKSVTDIQSELAMLENDNSAWAQKRKLELQAELSDAEKELNSFEKDHALDMTLDMLDEQQAAQEAQIQAQMDALDEKLNDPHALFNQALEDIKNNTAELYQQFIEYNRKHGTGNDKDIADMWEEAYIADLEYQDTHDGEHPDGIEIGNYTGYVRPENPTPPEPEEPSPPEEKPPEEPKEPEPPKLTDTIKKKVAAAIWNGGYGWGNGSTRTNRLTEVFGAGNGIQALVNKGVGKSGVSLTSEYTYANMRKKFKGYASGTDNATPGWHKLFEGDLDEYVFTSSDGNKYRMFSGLGDKVLNGEATDFLYDFANNGGTILTKMLADLFGQTNLGNVSQPIQAIEIHSGDIIVQGNANERTVSEIRRAQRENLEFVLKELNKLNK